MDSARRPRRRPSASSSRQARSSAASDRPLAPIDAVRQPVVERILVVQGQQQLLALGGWRRPQEQRAGVGPKGSEAALDSARLRRMIAASRARGRREPGLAPDQRACSVRAAGASALWRATGGRAEGSTSAARDVGVRAGAPELRERRAGRASEARERVNCRLAVRRRGGQQHHSPRRQATASAAARRAVPSSGAVRLIHDRQIPGDILQRAEYFGTLHQVERSDEDAGQ